MSKELGNRISILLKKQGLQQKELAERVGITEGVMSRYISGTRDPKPETLACIENRIWESDYQMNVMKRLSRLWFGCMNSALTVSRRTLSLKADITTRKISVMVTFCMFMFTIHSESNITDKQISS